MMPWTYSAHRARKPAAPQEVGLRTVRRDCPSSYLPFANLTGDGVPDYIVDGITEDLTTELSRLPGFLVIARNSAFAYKGKPIDIRRIGEELGCALRGGRQRAQDVDGALRINVQLVSTADRHALLGRPLRCRARRRGQDIDDHRVSTIAWAP